MIAGIDHFVLTVRSVEATCDFYQRVIGLERIGARGQMMSVYFRDPDGNLIEVSQYRT